MPVSGSSYSYAYATLGEVVAMGIAAVEVAIAAAVLYRRSRVTARGFRTA